METSTNTIALHYPTKSEGNITNTTPVNDDKQIHAEVLLINFIIQHNISFLTADHLAQLYDAMFPDLNIAKKFSCRRTKTMCLLNNALNLKIKSDLVENMAEIPYALVNDGSSDCVYIFCIYIFDVKLKQVELKEIC